MSVKETQVFDYKGVRIAVGSRVKTDDEQPQGTVEFIDDPEVDVDEEGRAVGINAAVGVQWDNVEDGDIDRVSTVYLSNYGGDPDFECEELEVVTPSRCN